MSLKKSQFRSFLFMVVLLVCQGEIIYSQSVQVGNGSYSTVLPSGAVGPSSSQGSPVVPKVSSNFNQPVQTNDWWSSLIFPFYGSQHSNTMYVLPLVVKAGSDGLGMGYTLNPVYAAADYLYPYQQQLTVGVEGLAASRTLVDSYGDWTVTASWNDGVRSMKSTIGHGLPYAFFTMTGGNAKVVCTENPVIWSNSNGVVGLTVAGRHYGIFAPAGSVWTGTTTLVSNLNGKDFLSVAVLPDNSPATLEFYRKRAYAFVTGSTVSWTYDKQNAKVISNFTLQTVLKDSSAGNLNSTLTALFRHQWLNTTAPLTSYSYVSVRGQMRIFDGSTFSTTHDFNGILPALPNEGIYNPSILAAYIDTVARETLPAGPIYENGKAIARFANVVHIADQLGKTAARDHFLQQIKTRLEAWLTVGGGHEMSYIANWNTISAYPSGYGADNQLNDHNFHYGYLIIAAATVAQYDPQWALESQWGGMINLLIKDCVNWDRNDRRFPFLRSFDPYEGHSWEAGHGDFGDGNNEESSSESMNFATGVALWGAATHNDTIRDLGIYLYANERSAIEQYFFDINDATFPAAYPRKALGMVWGGKGVHSTWFGADPEFIHGINFLPMTGGSLYHGRNPEYIGLNYAEMVNEIGSKPRKWKDVIWQWYAFADPQFAMNEFYADPNYEAFDGETKAHTYHWLGNLRRIGRLNITVTADIPTYAVFTANNQKKTYVAYNPGNNPVVVNFSDGYSMPVPARSMHSFNSDTSGAGLPVAVPISDISKGKAPLTVKFKGSNSFDRNGTITSYHWDFGDTTQAFSADTTHLYRYPGVYTAVLTVKNNLNLIGRGEIVITVDGNGTPYAGTPKTVPAVVQAEEYDLGGEGVAYHDSDPQNKGVPFRANEGVDIEGCGDVGGGYDVGWIVTGEWMEYTINVSETGYYELSTRVASVPGGGSYHISIDGVNVTGKKNVPVTGGWQFWTDVVSTGIRLEAGVHIMRFEVEGPEFNLNYINVKRDLTDIATEGNQPVEFALEQNYPNPFNPSTSIRFSLPESGLVKLAVYNSLGEKVETLVNKEMNSGFHSVVFDAKEFSSGVYFVKMESGSFVSVRKIVLLK
ncbi:MAG: carbohydrate-binding protein [Ignavibacteria bacterium]|nr:carbohydrate-binding protein [Ignavibacteria bacterium]